MLMETAVLQGKNYEVYLKWAKWLMIMGYVCVILNLLLWKFVNWGWIFSEYDLWERADFVRSYSYLLIFMSNLFFILSCFVLRKFPNIVYRTFATRLIITWLLALLYNAIIIIYIEIYGEMLIKGFFVKILIEFTISAVFIWAYSTLINDDKKQFVATISISVFWVVILFIIQLFFFELGDERIIGLAKLFSEWTGFIINIVYIILWKTLLATPTDISINLEFKKPALINRVLIGYMIVGVVLVIFPICYILL